MPAAVNVLLNVCPTVRFPEFHDPASAVVVCVLGPLFLHVTVVPTGMVIERGENWKFEMVTELVDWACCLIVCVCCTPAIVSGKRSNNKIREIIIFFGDLKNDSFLG